MRTARLERLGGHAPRGGSHRIHLRPGWSRRQARRNGWATCRPRHWRKRS